MKPIFKLVFYSLTGFILIASAGCSSKKKTSTTTEKKGGPDAQRPMRVDAFIVKTSSVAENIEVPGSLIANEATEIHPEISGRLVNLNVAEGKFVSRGSLLAKIYDGDLQAQLRKLAVQLQIAQKNEERSAQLLNIQGISKADYDASALNVSNTRADIDITKAAITKTEIRAPFSGKIGLKNISPGAFVTPQTVVVTIQQVDQLKLDFTVPEKYSAQMRPGKAVVFNVEGSGAAYTARVMATESSIAENTRALSVRALVQNKNANLVPGSFAKVKLSFDPDPNALMIPTQAVLPQARGKKVITYQGGTANFVDVTTGIRDSANVQILTGLKPGDTIVLTGLLSVRPQSKIQVGKIVNK